MITMMMLLLTKRLHDALLSVDYIRFGVGTAAIDVSRLVSGCLRLRFKNKKKKNNRKTEHRWCLGNPGVAA